MSGAVTALPPHAFMVWTGPALLLYLIGFIKDHQKCKSNKQLHATQQAHDINTEHVLVSPNGIQ